MPGTTPAAQLAAVHAQIAAVQRQIGVLLGWRDERRALGAAAKAALDATAQGTEAGCKAAIDALDGKDVAALCARYRGDDDHGNARDVARVLPGALAALRAIVWATPLPVLTVQGFGRVAVSATGPVTATATLVLSAPAKTSVAATATIGGLAASDVAGGKLSFPVEVPAGASSAPLPVGFAAQALTADKAGSLAFSGPSGATLGSPAGFSFVLKADAVATKNRSGLPFKDGANGLSNSLDEYDWIRSFETWRGCPIDVTTLFPGTNEPWSQLDKQVRGQEALIRRLDADGIAIVTTIPLITNAEGPGHFPDCAKGAYDQWHKVWAAFYAGLKLKHPVVVRLGHECDGTGTANPYPQDEAAGFANYKAAYARLADIYHAQGCLIDWNHLRHGNQRIDWRRAQPDLASFDILGADLYNNGWPMVTDPASWAAYRDATGPGGAPGGPASWLAYARKIGKPFGIAEAAVTNKTNLSSDPANDPTWCEQMFDWLAANAEHIAYHVYFHRQAEGTSHRIMHDNGHDVTPENAKAAAAYLSRRRNHG